MAKRNKIYRISLVMLLLWSAASQAQQALTAGERREVIDSLKERLNRFYVYPDMAKKMLAAVVANEAKGLYNNITDPSVFADRLTKDLTGVSRDRHLGVFFDPEWVRDSKKRMTAKDSLELSQRDFPDARAENFGFRDVKILDGNLGYLRLTKFWNASLGGETAVAAMAFLQHTDALIIDIRNNGGGDGSMVQLITSYLFDSPPVPIVTFYSRVDNKTTEDQTLPYVTGRRMPDKDLYILTSRQTFSAAESFTYMLKNRKRATIIGEATGGGAHIVDRWALTERFCIFLPFGRPIDPITKTDWEGTGVKPDIEVPAKDALLTAQLKALEKLTAADHKNIPATWALDALQAQLHPVTIPPGTLQQYTGSYNGGERNITVENGQLFYQRGGNPRIPLLPVTQELFMVEGISYLRVKFMVENGKVTGLRRLYSDGKSMTDIKDR